jgi:uncharacterized protein YkwD
MVKRSFRLQPGVAVIDFSKSRPSVEEASHKQAIDAQSYPERHTTTFAMMMLSRPNRCRSASPAKAGELPVAAVAQESGSGSSVERSPLTATPSALDYEPDVLSTAQVQTLASNLIALVNGERLRRGIHPLIPCKSLETFARMEAEAMAETGKVKPWFQSVQELEELLNSSKVGENICCGLSVEELHQDVVANPEQFLRLLSADFTEIGLSLSQGVGNKLYMCQLFRHQVPRQTFPEPSSS